MTLFFHKDIEVGQAPLQDYAARERELVLAVLRSEFDTNKNLIFKDIGSLIRIVDEDGGDENSYYLTSRVFKSPAGELIAVSDTVLGSGTFGTVYLAQNLETMEFCVAKEQVADISAEIINFNGIYADEFKRQTFAIQPKRGVNLWLGFMPFFNGSTCDEVGYACEVKDKKIKELNFLTRRTKESDDKRLARIKEQQLENTKAGLAERENSMVSVSVNESDVANAQQMLDDNHRVLYDLLIGLDSMSHDDLLHHDFAEYYRDLFSKIGNSKQDKLKTLMALEQQLAKRLQAKQLFDQSPRQAVGVLDKNCNMDDLIINLQLALKSLASYTSRIKVAHEAGYILKDQKAENTIINTSGDIYLIDTAGVQHLELGQTSIVEEQIMPACTEFYISKSQQEALKHNQIYYNVLFMAGLRADPDLGLTTASAAELAYKNSQPKRHVYSKKSDAYALGMTLHLMLLKIVGASYDEDNLPNSFTNPKNEPAIDLLNRALEIIASLKSELRLEDQPVDAELQEFKKLLNVIEALNHFDRSKAFLPNMIGKIWGTNETEHEKMWRAATSVFVANVKAYETLDNVTSKDNVTSNYTKVVVPGIAEIKRTNNDVFVQLPVLTVADIESGGKIDPVLAMLDNLNPGASVIIGNCSTTPEVALKLFERAVTIGLKPEYDKHDGTDLAIQDYVISGPKLSVG